MQKAVLSRQQQVRQRPILAPPIQTVNQSPHLGQPRNSPNKQPTPPSQHSSPSTARSPGFALQGGMASPASDLQAQHTQRPMGPTQHHSFPSQPRTHLRQLSTPITTQSIQGQRLPTSAAHNGNYYPASFQKHYDQLGKLALSFFPFPSCGALFVLG
jgi:hypothetical protein